MDSTKYKIVTFLYMIYFDKNLKIILNPGKDSALYSDRMSFRIRYSPPACVNKTYVCFNPSGY